MTQQDPPVPALALVVLQPGELVGHHLLPWKVVYFHVQFFERPFHSSSYHERDEGVIGICCQCSVINMKEHILRQGAVLVSFSRVGHPQELLCGRAGLPLGWIKKNSS
jgi:hypothetical protein